MRLAAWFLLMCNKLCNWGNFYSGRLTWSGRLFALDGQATLDTPGASRFWTLGALWTVPVLWTLGLLWTLWGVQTRAVLINCCILKHVDMVWRPAQESNWQASRVNQLKIWVTYEITVQYMCNWKSTLKKRCKSMSLEDFFTGILEEDLTSRS